MYLSVCLSVQSTGHWGSCQLVIGSLQVKMTCGGAAALALSPCPALDRRHGTLSLPMAYRKGDRGDRGGRVGRSLRAPLTPQNEIDRLTEVIAPSTIFFGRKYCYRQIGDSISGRRWGSGLWSKGCVCPLLLRLQCLLMFYLSALPFLPCTVSSFLYLFRTFSHPCTSFVFFFHFSHLTTATDTASFSPISSSTLFPIPRVYFRPFFLLLTIFVSLTGENSITQWSAGNPPSRSSDCFSAASMVV